MVDRGRSVVPKSPGQVILGLALLVGCFAAAALAVMLGISLVPNDPAGSCFDVCLYSDQTAAAILALFFGLPAWAIGLLVALIRFVMRLNRGRSPVRVGATAATTGLSVALVLVVGALAVWTLGHIMAGAYVP
jgi:hypothetical protein